MTANKKKKNVQNLTFLNDFSVKLNRSGCFSTADCSYTCLVFETCVENQELKVKQLNVYSNTGNNQCNGADRFISSSFRSIFQIWDCRASILTTNVKTYAHFFALGGSHVFSSNYNKFNGQFLFLWLARCVYFVLGLINHQMISQS